MKRPKRKPSGNTVGLQALSAIVTNVELGALRDITPKIHLDDSDKGRNLENTAYNFIRDHHDAHQVLPTLDIIADNTGIVLPETDAPAKYYMDRMRQRAMFNNIADPYNRLQEALSSPRTSMQQMQEAIEDLHAIKLQFIDAGTGIETSEYLLEEVARLSGEAKMSGGLIRGITTGYDELDITLDGYQSQDLIVWVGRPGRSKSWFLLKQCHAAWMAGYKPLYVSMEMGGVQNMRRILGIHSGINPTYIKRGEIQTLAQPLLDRAVAELLEERPLQMVTANFTRTVDSIGTFIETHRPDIVYIDAGYLLSPRKQRYGSSGRRETISDVIEELKELAANHRIPMVITVQFNRQAEHRRRAAGGGGSFNPIAHLSLAEIGETDVIGQVATHVLGIEYPPAPLLQNTHRCFGFLKGREGETGWWLTKFIQTQHSPVDLSLVPHNDPLYDVVRRAATARNNQDGRAVDPNHRTSLMRLNNG
jgi:replicative DNA helicase